MAILQQLPSTPAKRRLNSTKEPESSLEASEKTPTAAYYGAELPSFSQVFLNECRFLPGPSV
jgi:hypothetical protein